MLKVDAIGKRFGEVTALDGCSFNVERGRMLGFLGPNGAGKTTTMRAIFDLVELDAGAVLWDGRPIGPVERLRFGYMPEERGLYPRMGVGEQRAQLAAALVHTPELLVLDEPFAGLDPVAVRTLAQVLRDQAARGVAVLFSSHQLDLVEEICEEVAIIDRGRIVAEGNLDALRRASERRRIALRLDGAPAGGN